MSIVIVTTVQWREESRVTLDQSRWKFPHWSPGVTAFALIVIKLKWTITQPGLERKKYHYDYILI